MKKVMFPLVGVILFSLLLSFACADTDFPVAENKEERCAIVIGRQAHRTEAHAAKELANYLERISGAHFAIFKTDNLPQGNTPLILIGDADGNPLVDSLVKAGKVNLSAEESGLDGFIIKECDLNGRRYLVLGGSRPRGTLYAVYYLLEKYCNVGFFFLWDGEQVPRKETIVLPANIDVKRRSKFRVRIHHHGGYTPWTWATVPRWKRIFDDTAKHYANVAYCEEGAGTNYAESNRELGISKTGAGPAGLKVAQEIYDLAHERDLDILSRSFAEDYIPHHEAWRSLMGPETRTWDVASKYTYEGPQYNTPDRHIWPGDPLYLRITRTHLATFRRLFGDCKYNYGMDPPSEQPHRSAEEGRELVFALARTMKEALPSAGSGARWVASNWGMISDPSGVWDEKTTKGFFSIIGDDILIGEAVHGQRGYYGIPKVNYYWGAPWFLGNNLDFGGEDYMRGDMGMLLDEVAEITYDPRGKNFQGLGYCPESCGYNGMFVELIFKLSWDPEDVPSLDSFLSDYASRRYGMALVDKTFPVVKKIASAFYMGPDCTQNLFNGGGRYGGSVGLHKRALQNQTETNLYQQLWGSFDIARWAYMAGVARDCIDELLKLAPQLSENELYKIDLVDFTRQYIRQLGDLHLARLEEASYHRDVKAIQEEGKQIDFLLEQLETVLSSLPKYRLTDIARQKVAETGGALDSTMRALRDTDVVSRPMVHDYQTRDMQEHVRGLFRPRIATYVNYLTEIAGDPAKKYDIKELEERYSVIEHRFVDKGPEPEEVLPSSNPVPVVIAGILKEIDGCKGLVIDGLSMPQGNTFYNSDFEKDTKGWFTAGMRGGIVEHLPLANAHKRCLRLAAPKGRINAFPQADPGWVAQYGLSTTVAEASQRVHVKENPKIGVSYRLNEISEGASFGFWVKGRDKAGNLRFQAAYPAGPGCGDSSDGRSWGFQGISTVWRSPQRKFTETEGILRYPDFHSIHKDIPAKLDQWHTVVLDLAGDLDRSAETGTWKKKGITELEVIPCGFAGAGHSFDVLVDYITID